MIQRYPLAFVLASMILDARRVEAWPADISQRMARDALKLLPKSLSELIVANDAEIFADARTSKMPALPLIYLDLPKGGLSPGAKAALAREFSDRVSALQGQNFRTAVIALGATYRLAVDLADPALGMGIGVDAKAKAIRREFYLFVAANRDKIPLVVVEPASMRLKLDSLPAFLADVASQTPAQAARLREEGLEDGRVLPFAEIDFRSPVFAVASTAYSRSVSAVAATWIAVWRSAGGDMQRQKSPQTINPRPVGLKQEE